MGKVRALSEAEIDVHLKEAEFWRRTGPKGQEIQRTWKFPSFAEAIKFVNFVAASADKMNHHPDILVQYNKVTLTLSTHDAGGLSERDFQFAKICDELTPGC